VGGASLRGPALSTRVRSAYRHRSLPVRTYVRVRQAIAPLLSVERLAPDHGRILEFGCGMGVFATTLAFGSPGRTIVGVDLDPDRIRIGSEVVAGAGLGDRVALEAVDDAWEPEVGAFDAVVVVDVLYLLPPERIERTVRALLAALRPGGVLIVKEIGTTPRWKHAVGRLQEFLAVRVLRITTGSALTAEPLASVDAALRAAGWSGRVDRLDRGYYYPHVAVTAVRPAE
jgi:cyclopropane fatty-acyl-phospholipid synthase-like methyltransferase